MNPRYWMDIFSHLFVVRIIMFAVKGQKTEKEAGVGPLKKTISCERGREGECPSSLRV